MATIKERLYALAEPVAAQCGVDIVDIELAGSARKTIVRLLIDKPGGVTLEDCSACSRAFSAVLDVEDPIRTAYVLEVSSPGLDRPLKTLKDYRLSIGRLVRVVSRESIEGLTFFIGRLEAVDEKAVTLVMDGSKEVRVPFEQISKARLEMEL